jgi:hypothetical protein
MSTEQHGIDPWSLFLYEMNVPMTREKYSCSWKSALSMDALTALPNIYEEWL